jgi:hypothetical protein
MNNVILKDEIQICDVFLNEFIVSRSPKKNDLLLVSSPLKLPGFSLTPTCQEFFYRQLILRTVSIQV